MLLLWSLMFKALTSIDMCSILIDFYENPICKKNKNVGRNVNEIGFEISLPLWHQNFADFVSSLPRIYAKYINVFSILDDKAVQCIIIHWYVHLRDLKLHLLRRTCYTQTRIIWTLYYHYALFRKCSFKWNKYLTFYIFWINR